MISSSGSIRERRIACDAIKDEHRLDRLRPDEAALVRHSYFVVDGQDELYVPKDVAPIINLNQTR